MQPNRALYQEFPPELRNAYGDAVKAREWSSRHKGLLDFAEAALGYLASLSLSDYRTRSGELAGNVELAIEGFREKPLTMGRLLDLFRASATAMTDPIVPSAGLFADAQLDGMRRFLAAIAAIDAAMAGLSPAAPPSALNVAHHVENAQLGAMEQADWWDGWSRLIDYRNRVAHAAGPRRWPTGSDGYWEAMGPLLHEAVVEMLAHDAVVEAVLKHPVATISLLSQKESGEDAHLVCGEERGVLFEREIVAAIVMLVPRERVDTPSVPFTGQEELAKEYASLLANMDSAIGERSLSLFAEQSTRSAELNQRFLVNPYSRALSKRLDELGALGLNVGHSGTVCGLLFPNTEEGQMTASEACFKVKEQFRDLKDVKVVTTPHCEAAAR